MKWWSIKTKTNTRKIPSECKILTNNEKGNLSGVRGKVYKFGDISGITGDAFGGEIHLTNNE